MKKLIVALNLLILFSSAIAQKRNVNRALNYKESGELEKALEYIQAAINPGNEKSKKTINWPRTWEVRGEIYQAIYHSDNKKLKDSITEPLTEALNSYKKAAMIDDGNKYVKNLKIRFTLLINDLQTNAVQAFNDTIYSEALKSFEQILEIHNLPVMADDIGSSVDTGLIYNCGMAALNAEKYDKAIKYFKESIEYNYNGSKPYVWIARVYEQKRDSLAAIKSLKKGTANCPANVELVNEIIRIYMNLKMNNEAMKYLETAIQINPENASYYVAKGNVYDKTGDQENAINSYEKALSLNPELFEAHYNLGVLYYNSGVKQMEIANQVPPNDNITYQKEIKKSEVWWKKSLPYMEKCYEIYPDNHAILETLKTLYYRLEIMNKYNLINKALEE